ncbi:ArsR/SmtB family transcription factor [Alkalicoccobacillus porphyridii]|uniref:Winged helix-turn-helix transcriptional regulator n=1 Tax=Alkalicoccobacillus porphyridii TaxID=2597270 RepID=A0A554A202_9BACI|nr:metalloregulator ArsR/SmtB family transcription factor [Alkalicoccobacillus porphyridii]TSB47724.1 winged helix-turn-helix transcriptional regulator [Alkalicoccobacillus porphyridii]
MPNLYRAFADPTRREIIAMTAYKECTQTDLVAAFSISQPAIKKHIDLLISEELLLVRKEGKFRYYRLNQAVYSLEVQKVQLELETIFDYKLQRLKGYLEEENNE